MFIQRLRGAAGAVPAALAGVTGVATIRRRISGLLIAATVVAALVVAGCGTSPNTSTQAPAQSSSTTQATQSGSSAGIPQGNGGDQDADNNGGPSDGDGSI